MFNSRSTVVRIRSTPRTFLLPFIYPGLQKLCENHPVTKGIENFTTFDELWINARVNKSFSVLGSATNKARKAEGLKNQPAIFVKDYGKGHIFHTILGHNTVAMNSKGFQQLIIQGTEWAASGKTLSN